ncbi:DUF1820 family protein [Zobellella taiwanensis]|jgi:hypothetical protein|uniref:DUF1820 domain-containing protein n=1 Tax=Zobellella taiwanensis TaxID=347535 RepID=A0A2P7QT03_9GAMM|nr:DUF1820 family protein [Zobellella taiwanensis]PSJ41081.1 DUF1820 domain-containing protein [Zobellella taiwanensis]
MKTAELLYRVQFINAGKHYEIYVREVTQGGLFGFVELADFVWDTRTSLLVDPAEDKLKSEFADVNRTYVPLHQILRIDAVEKRGAARLTELGDKVTPFPTPIYTPKPGS